MHRIRAWHLSLVLLLLTVVAYLPLWRNDFVDLDDDIYITTNSKVQQGITTSSFHWAWTNTLAPYWHPLTWLSLQFDAHFFSSRTESGEVLLSPAAFHGQNLFWHCASVLLLFALFHRLTGACWRSFLVAALFAVHPMHVESVAWAIERKDVLSGFFGILTLWAYARYAQRPGWKLYLCTMLAFTLSLLAKPMLMTLPFVMLLLDRWPLRRWREPDKEPIAATGLVCKRVPLRRLVLEKYPLFALAGLFAALTLQARADHGSLIPLARISLVARLANSLSAYGWYLRSTFWPDELAVLYPHPRDNWSVLQVLTGLGLMLAVTLFCFRQVKPWFLVGWLWFVAVLFPVIGLAQGGRQAWADRFSYFPHIGLFVAVVWGLGELVCRYRIPSLASGLAAGLVLAALALLTWNQVSHWQDRGTLWEHAVLVTEDNDIAHEYLARWYRTQGRLAEMEFQLALAVRAQRKHVR
jgi:hypothetical protein